MFFRVHVLLGCFVGLITALALLVGALVVVSRLQQFDSFCHGSFCMLLLSTCRHNLAGAAAVILVLHRQVQDEFAAASHRKAAAAQTAGKFSAEIVPVHTKVKDPKTGSEQKVGCRRHC
jgi:hypothetical protein